MAYKKKKKIPLYFLQRKIYQYQYEALTTIAQAQNKTVTTVLRESVDEYIQSDRKSVYGAARAICELSQSTDATDEKWEIAIHTLMNALKYK